MSGQYLLERCIHNCLKVFQQLEYHCQLGIAIKICIPPARIVSPSSLLDQGYVPALHLCYPVVHALDLECNVMNTFTVTVEELLPRTRASYRFEYFKGDVVKVEECLLDSGFCRLAMIAGFCFVFGLADDYLRNLHTKELQA